MYKPLQVRYWFELDSEGPIEAIIPVEEGPGQRRKEVPVPHLVRSVGVKAKLLSDNSEYVLGLGREGSSETRVRKQQAAFRELVERCWKATHEPAVLAVLRFLRVRHRNVRLLERAVINGEAFVYMPEPHVCFWRSILERKHASRPNSTSRSAARPRWSARN